MKNIALSVDENVLARVRRIAAERNSSANALVREYLTYHEYRASRARARLRELSKRTRGRLGRMIESREFGTSAQVLQEFFVTVVRKAAAPMPAALALEWIEQWAEFPCQAIDRRLVRIVRRRRG